MLRAIPALLAACLLALGCSSTRGGDEETEPTGIRRITDSGELRVGMTGEQPPLNMTTVTGELVGLEVALSRVLAQNMGVQARFVTIPFPKLLDSLEAGEVDLIMSGMTITPARNLRAKFVGPYFVSGKSLLSRSKEILQVRSATALNRTKYRFAALAGSTSEEFVQRVMPNAILLTTSGLDEAIQLVLDDEVDALVADQETCHFGALRHPDSGLAAREQPLTIEPIGIAIAPDDSLLANLLQNYLDALQGRGVLQQAQDFWFENDEWLKALR